MLLDHPDFPLIDLAGEAAAQAYQLILAGQPLPFTLYQRDHVGQARSTQPRGALAEVRAQLHGAGATGQVLLFEMNARFDDCPAERALFVEFGAASGLMHGLVLALPYTSNPQRRCIPGMIQLQRCPAGLRHLADDLLPRFTRALRKSPSGSAWQQAREYDRLAAPSLEAFEATRRAVDAFCPALRADDPAGDSNVLANRHVDALIERYPFEHGIAYRKALYQLGLDLSAASLLRIDNLLEQLQPRLEVSDAQFLAHPAKRNFLHVLAFYIGTVVAQESGARIDWFTARQLQQAHAIAVDAVGQPRLALAGLLNKSEVYFPLHMLLDRLFGPCSGAQFRATLKELGRMAAASRAPRLQDDMEHVQRRIDLARSTDPGYLVPARPSWVDGDSIDLWFQNVGALFLGGRLVWGQITQANSLMWQEGDANCPGEVLYDLRGIPTGEELGPIATTIFDYKGTRPLDHRLAFLSDHLMHERTRSFGLPLPLRLSSSDLRLTTIFFDRKHLPGGYLQSGLVPLLIHDAYPGIVTVLPERFWTVEVQAHARRNGWPV
ncbi:hypothetical protein ACN9MY_28410 [Pseudoduganella sp. R-31]|uniref:hypothetical protein n=1 Tax=Pseudoduganella sp. R-31 TaxID=3404060 RepID=UPI003CF2F4B9